MEPDFYEGAAWKTLDPVDRAQLLLVIEGAKRGVIINVNLPAFEQVAGRTGLAYSFNTEPSLPNPVVQVARPDDMAKYQTKLAELPEDAIWDYHRAVGDFLGYPACCVEEYVKERTPEQKAAARRGERHLTYRFGQEMAELIARGEPCPKEFDYRPPAFTPCSVRCESALEMLGGYGELLERLDPEAAEALASFNRRFVDRLESESAKARAERRILVAEVGGAETDYR